MSLNKESQNNKQDKQDKPISSLAELSRQYLYGNVDVEAYLALEKQLTPRFSKSTITTTSIEQEIKASGGPKKQQTDPKSDERK